MPWRREDVNDSLRLVAYRLGLILQSFGWGERADRRAAKDDGKSGGVERVERKREAKGTVAPIYRARRP